VLSQLAAFIQSVKGSILLSWLLMVLMAAALALMASGRPRRPARRWFGDFFVRWGLAGLFLWFVFFALWALREVLAQSFVFPVGPIQGFIENATLWGVVLTGFLTITFFGGTLMLQALFSKAEVPEGVVYYRQEVIVTPQRIAGREVFAHLPEEPPELREEAAAREALSAKRRG
jgi:hypothetical protein